MGDLVDMVGEQELSNLENSSNWTKVTPEEYEDVLNFIKSTNAYSDFIYVGHGESDKPLTEKGKYAKKTIVH